MKKVYVRQVAPECQESNLMYFGEESLPEGVIISGNNRLTCMGVDLEDNLIDNMNSLVVEIRLYWATEEDYDILELVNLYFDRNYGSKEQWERLVFDYSDLPDFYPLLDLLELTTGEKYNSSEIRGSAQGDWQILYYPAKFGNDFVKWVENEYFNLGSQWIIHEMDYEPETAEDVDGYSVYLTASGYDMDEVRREFVEYYISEHENINPEDVVFFKYAGTKPNYERV